MLVVVFWSWNKKWKSISSNDKLYFAFKMGTNIFFHPLHSKLFMLEIQLKSQIERILTYSNSKLYNQSSLNYLRGFTSCENNSCCRSELLPSRFATCVNSPQNEFIVFCIHSIRSFLGSVDNGLGNTEI